MHYICCIGLSSPHRVVRVRVHEFITLGGFGLLDGLVIFIVKIVKRPMWPRFPRELPIVVCSREGCEVAIVSQLCISFPYVLHGLCEDYLTWDIAFNAVMPLSRASTRGRYSRIEGVTAWQTAGLMSC